MMPLDKISLIILQIRSKLLNFALQLIAVIFKR